MTSSSPSTQYRDPLPPTISLESLPALTEDRNSDGKSLANPPRSSQFPRSIARSPDSADENLSEWYTSYPEELDTSNNAYECVNPEFQFLVDIVPALSSQ